MNLFLLHDDTPVPIPGAGVYCFHTHILAGGQAGLPQDGIGYDGNLTGTKTKKPPRGRERGAAFSWYQERENTAPLRWLQLQLG